ncbi:DUF6386 family protein [Pseudomonas juntendi]|uniref:DUF6386 family protein n=1 Tax=Pseudomonas juntendi TaxID=2666183 RepID=UPI001F1FEC81|nr:DUF6386 family protein [Pseudomonas juntendi]MCO7058155.1 DUF6386 family protein [Pseudomonas juntendi]UJM11775.1 DUF6386 family protein [Pseudomonas juntendi]UXA37904.1 hypothetical protein KZA81_20935 [Pseudomonas juntendi]
MAIEFDVVTDTATLAVFDLQAIRHRTSDTFDWWSIQSDEISEMNEGNIAFLNLGADGRYQVKIVDNLVAPSGGVYLKVPSGQVFIGAGEDTSGGGLEPDGSDAVQGEFISLEAGSYYMGYKVEDGGICLAFSPSNKFRNALTDSIRLGA